MKFYNRYPGDLMKKTAGLSMAQMGAYDRFIDWCYANETGIDPEEVYLIAHAQSDQDRADVDRVLRKFFEQGEDGLYRQQRIEEEIAAALPRIQAARENGKKGGRPPKVNPEGPKPTGFDPGTQQGGDQEPGGKANHEPDSSSSKKKRRSARAALPSVDPAVLLEAGFDAQAAADFIAHKDAVKAPLTERAWKDHVREAGKAGWTPAQAAEKVMAKAWKGFEAKYVASEAPPAAPRRPGGPEPVHGNAAPDAAATQRMLAEQAKVRPAKPSPELAAALKSLTSPQRSAA